MFALFMTLAVTFALGAAPQIAGRRNPPGLHRRHRQRTTRRRPAPRLNVADGKAGYRDAFVLDSKWNGDNASWFTSTPIPL
jgi:hypothetical protein